MASPSIIRRNFESFKGEDQSTSDLTRGFEYANEATNIVHLRNSSIVPRAGGQPRGLLSSQAGYGQHVYEYAKDERTFFTGFQFPSAATTLSYTPPSGSTATWANPINATTNNNSYARYAPSGGVNYSDWLVVSNFGFSIPTDSYVTGVVVRIRDLTNTTLGAAHLISAAFTADAGVTIDGEERSGSFTAATSETVRTIGSENDFWGSAILSPNIINSTGFGVGIRDFNTAAPFNYDIDSIEIGLYYKPLVPETTTELLAVGSQLYRQKKGTIEIANSSGTDFTVSFYPVSGAGYALDVQAAGVSESGFPKSYSTGTNPTLINQVQTDLNTVSGLAATVTPIARINGAVVNGTSFTVDASPQTFQDGDRVGFTDSAKGIDVWRQLHEVSGTTFNIDVEASVSDNEWLGLGREPVSSMPILVDEALDDGETLTIEVPYMEGIHNVAQTETFSTLQVFASGIPGIRDQPFFNSSYSGNVGQRNFSLVDARNVAYMAVPFYLNKGVNTITVDGEIQKANTGLWKYDGNAMYGAGLPYPPDDFSSATTGAVTYKYKFQLKHVDFRGNIVKGPVLTPTFLINGITAASGTPNVAFDWDHGLQATIFPVFFAKVDSTASDTSTNTITVDEEHSLIPGMNVILWDDSGSGEFITRRVTACTRDSITIDGDAIDYDGTALSGQDSKFFISTMRLVTWRTEGNGSVHYYAGERPVGGTSGSLIWTDDTPDTALGSSLITPDRAADPFPKLSYLTLHQGLIVGAGNPDEPEVVYFEDAVCKESSPLATSSFSALGGGKITAIASDSDDMLAVFKDKSYFNIVGDLDSITFQVLEVSKGEYGCPGHHALVKVQNALIFPSTEGFKAISSGVLVSELENRYVDDFSANFYEQKPGAAISSNDEDKLVYKRAVAAFNPETGEYLCYIPTESGTPQANSTLRPNANSKLYVFNTVKQSWYQWSLPLNSNPAGGMVFYEGSLWWQSRILDTVVKGQVHQQKKNYNKYDYADDDIRVIPVLRMAWDSLDLPSSYFKPLFLKVYQMRPDEFISPGFDIAVNEYRDFNETNKYTQASRSFSVSSDRQRRIKFRTGKATAISVEFTTPSSSTDFQKMILTGYEYSVGTPYSDKFRSRRGQ